MIVTLLIFAALVWAWGIGIPAASARLKARRIARARQTARTVSAPRSLADARTA